MNSELKLIVPLIFPRNFNAEDIHSALNHPRITYCLKNNNLFSNVHDSSYKMNPTNDLACNLCNPYVRITDITVNDNGIHAVISGNDDYINFLYSFKKADTKSVYVLAVMSKTPEGHAKILYFTTHYILPDQQNILDLAFERNVKQANGILKLLNIETSSDSLSVIPYSYLEQGKSF
jgi:hypothetical protein